jgi:hypothetical protein
MPALTRTVRILAAHAPYLSKHSDNKLCMECATSDCGGEFATVIEWAQHVERILNGKG